MADKPKIVDLSAEKQAAKELPPNHKCFHFSITDPDTGRDLTGEFVCRRMNIGQIREMAMIKAELNGGKPDDVLDPVIAALNNMVAHLRVSLIRAPDWWKPEEFYSADIISHVYAEVMAFEATFRDASARRVAQNAAANSQGQS